MPVACSTTSLTGQEGSIFFQPAGTEFCLLDHTDFPAGTSITVPGPGIEGGAHDYQIGDEIQFTQAGTAVLDTAITTAHPLVGQVSGPFFVVATTATTIEVSTTRGGAAITLNGDGGTGTADTPGAANHIEIDLVDYSIICQVREFSVEISREELDVTTLPCTVGGSSKYAAFRKTQAGYASGTGTMTVYFTDDQTSLANRLLGNVLLKSQAGAQVKLYLNTVATNGAVNDHASLYIESEISINSMSLSVNPDDPTSAELSFSIVNPLHVLGADLV